jgi:replicative DNA helicase
LHADRTGATPDRLPPHNDQAERGVLGGILRDPDTLDTVRGALSAEDFFADAHQKIFRAICEIANDGKPVDLVLVHDRLRRNRQLDDVGGAAYLGELSESVPTGANVQYHAKLVRDAAKVRALIHTCNEILRDAYDGIAPADELVAMAERKVFDLSGTGAGARELRAAPEILPAELARIDERIAAGGRLGGLPTGYPDLDHLLGGLRPGQLVIIAARPSGGKTALALNIAANNAAAGVPVLFVSLEQPESEIAGRLLSMHSGVPMHRFTRGARLTPDEAARLNEAGSRSGFGGYPLHMDDNPDQTAAQVAALCRYAVRRHGVALVVVDYVQLIASADPKENVNQRVGRAALTIKKTARACNIPVILLAQLNRAVEDRPDTRPRLSDLRDSGELEQLADLVLLLANQRDQPEERAVWKVDAIVGKNRNGPRGEVTLDFNRAVMRFETPLAV